MLRPVWAFVGMSLSTSESYVNYLTFIDFFFFGLTLTNIFFPFRSIFLIFIFLSRHLFVFLNWLVNAEKLE